MQLQLRNYAPLIEARLILLRAQPHLRVNWIALAVAHDLADNKAQAVRVLTAYEDVTKDVPPHNYEFSEVVLYHASILAQLHEPEQVLAILEKYQDKLYDLPAIDDMKAAALYELGRTTEAESVLRRLLERNPENKSTIRRLLDLLAKDKSAEERESLVLSQLLQLQETFPKATALRRVALDEAHGAQFATHARDYIERALVKNVPSLFSDVKPLYKDAAKQAAVEEIVEQFRQEWDPTQEKGTAEPPSSYLWTMYFLAHHYSYTGRAERALQYIDSAIAHSPAMPELYMTRARILKRAGAYQAASDAMEDARLLDGQDRYLNTKAAKYLLRADRVEESSRVLKLFTKPDVPDPVADLVDMQAVGYLIEDAKAHKRTGDDALALKRFHQIDKILAEIYDDQLDFHSYCLRKMTLRSYIQTVHFEDDLYARPVYVQAASGAIELYAQLHDEQAAAGSEAAQAAAQKRAAVTEKKAAMRAELVAAASKQVERITEDDLMPAPDVDPYGEKLFATSKPLEDAHHYVRKLQVSNPNAIETWLSTFEVALREQKWMLVLRALSLAYAIDAAHPMLHVQLLRFRKAIEATPLPDAAAAALKDLSADVPPLAAPLEALQTEFVQRHGTQSPAHVLGAAEGLWILRGSTGASDAAELVSGLARPEMKTSLAAYEQAYAFLQRIEARGAALDASVASPAFAKAAHAAWPRADAFKAPHELEAESNECAAARATWLPPATP